MMTCGRVVPAIKEIVDFFIIAVNKVIAIITSLTSPIGYGPGFYPVLYYKRTGAVVLLQLLYN